MKKIIFILAVLTISLSQANITKTIEIANKKTPTMQELNNLYARRGNQGCCSHHGGVRGCDSNSGKLLCNDGTLSPSCRC